MQSLRRTTVAAARTGRTNLSRQPRRYAHDTHAHGHGHGPVNEPMGRGFWGTIAVIPTGWAIYAISRTNSDNTEPFFTRMIAKYTEAQERWARSNDIHVRLIEQAGEDRVLFMNSRPQEYVDMKFPEIMNVGSPYNVPAGSQVPMDQVIAKYKKLAYEENERKLEVLRNNEIKSEQPFEGKERIRKAPDIRVNIQLFLPHICIACSFAHISLNHNWTSFNANAGEPKIAPLLPELSFTTREENVMNGSAWTSDDPLHTANAIPPRSAIAAAMPAYTSSRNVSGPLAVETAVMAGDPNATSPWARPNPHSIPNSKTSQYIDKITSENDRLRRELTAEKLAREDETKRVSAARSKAEDSRAEFQHLQVLADTNARAIERKDRKLDELKATLEAEAKRRRVAEQRAEEALKMLGDTRSETQRQLSQAYEMKGLAETQLETARDGFKRITDGYEKKIRHINEALHELRKQRIEDADKIKRQAIISDQLHHEMTRTTRSEDRMTDMMAAYKREHRKEMDALLQEAQRLRLALPEKEREAQRLTDDMKETRDKMRWVMTQQRQQTGS
ncbi:uncharacterized protein K460DRAFT_387050 [Cucurbitaria berberidis CBS 394.84]|uniref:Uncharacterized protein n=1 Tax=Cucurbitaria berberidis CBS 394.84 TaxID=1168544 RepID=A0A9P4GCD2_9PLEO|nr:uncharacterized protein K460DRAFT_387050 [Cucurbitaria berberidis CBS 394.84]KAF1842756.1 hypothetical protein K460DRAFT_387050 [Cucurbitaria berberidis CBS 394.84]